MRRLLAGLLIVGLSGTGLAWRQPSPPVEVPDRLPPAPSSIVACPAVVDRTSGGSLDLASSRLGEVRLTSVAAGSEIESIPARIDAAGGESIDLARVSPGGLAGVLVEHPVPESAASVVQSGIGLAGALCTHPATTTLLVPGASTRAGEHLELRLVNPYAVDAVVSVLSSSESGIDSASELESVVVPAGSVVTRELSRLLTLRTSLSVLVRVDEGAVHAVLAQEGDGDRMLLEGVPPATEWWLPVPRIGSTAGRLVIASAAPADVDVEVDVWTPEGREEALVSDVVPAEAHLDLPLEEVAEQPTGLRVTASGPVAAAIVFEGEGVRAGGPGSSTASTSWFAPGVTAGASGALWILNPEEVEAELVLQPLAPNTPGQAFTVPAGSVRSFLVDDLGAGYAARSSSAVVLSSVIAGEQGVALLPARPLIEFEG